MREHLKRVAVYDICEKYLPMSTLAPVHLDQVVAMPEQRVRVVQTPQGIMPFLVEIYQQAK